jgi:hypothetical protein
MIESLAAIDIRGTMPETVQHYVNPAISAKVTSCKCSLANPVDFTPNATSQIAIKVHVAMQEVSDIYTRAAQPANNLMSMTATIEPALRGGIEMARLHELA